MASGRMYWVYGFLVDPTSTQSLGATSLKSADNQPRPSRNETAWLLTIIQDKLQLQWDIQVVQSVEQDVSGWLCALIRENKILDVLIRVFCRRVKV